MAAVVRYRQRSTVQLGNEIKCNRCLVIKNRDAFSTKSLEALADLAASNPRFNPKVTQHVPCIACTARQVTELQCSMCDKWKGLDAFSKAQRRERDKAKCWPCMKEQLEADPTGESSSEDDDSGSEGSEAFYSGDDDVTTNYTNTRLSSLGGARVPQSGATFYTGNSSSIGTGWTSIANRSIASATATPAVLHTTPSSTSTTPSAIPKSIATTSTGIGTSWTRARVAPAKQTASIVADESDNDTDQCISDNDD